MHEHNFLCLYALDMSWFSPCDFFQGQMMRVRWSVIEAFPQLVPTAARQVIPP